MSIALFKYGPIALLQCTVRAEAVRGCANWRRVVLLAGERRDGLAGVLDSAVQVLGKAGFLPQFAVFPVKYLDSDMAVFTFPPLRDSLIAVRKVS